MKPAINKIAIYAKNMERISVFYQKHFDFELVVNEDDRLIELASPCGGCRLIILQASKGHRMGQSCIKLVFDVQDVEKFKSQKLKEGLKFGSVHQADGYVFSNARDPEKNPVQISSRAFRQGSR